MTGLVRDGFKKEVKNISTSGATNLALVANYIILVPFKYTRENKLAGISKESHKDLDYNR